MQTNEDANEAEEIRDSSALTDALEFWKDEREDVYQDLLAQDADLPDVQVSDEEIMAEVRAVRYGRSDTLNGRL